MAEYIVQGGNILSGEVDVSGAKNAALPIIAASVLTEGAIIYNCPDLSDTRACIDILKELGCSCDLINGTLTIEPYFMSKNEIPLELCRRMRSSVTFLGALLGRFNKAVIYSPGGCALGKRPIDIHLEALEKMGVKIEYEGEKIICAGTLVGAEIKLRYPSVGATENLVLAAVMAKGITVLKNCAREPEIVAMVDFLNKSGAKIKGAGTDKITIEGVDKLNRCEYTVPGDRIEAATFLCAAAITGGEMFVRGVGSNNLMPVIGVLRGIGCVIRDLRGCIYIDAPKKLSAVKAIVTAPYPAFPTDVQPQITAVLADAIGQSCVLETVFEARNKHIPELNKMGADIKCESGNCFVINGVESLHGAQLEASDLRGGAALTIATLAAEGESRVKNVEYIQRGYEGFEEKLKAVGAEIRLVR